MARVETYPRAASLLCEMIRNSTASLVAVDMDGYLFRQTSSPALTTAFASLSSKLNMVGFSGSVCCKACHLLTQLPIDFVGDCHYADQQQTEIDTSQVVLQRVEDTHL